MLQNERLFVSMASEPVLCLLTTFSHLAANSLRDALPCFTSLLSFVDNTLYHFDDLVVMTQHVTAQTVSKIMCRLPNKARLPTHSSFGLHFISNCNFRPLFVFGCFHRNKDDEETSKGSRHTDSILISD